MCFFTEIQFSFFVFWDRVLCIVFLWEIQCSNLSCYVFDRCMHFVVYTLPRHILSISFKKGSNPPSPPSPFPDRLPVSIPAEAVTDLVCLCR